MKDTADTGATVRRLKATGVYGLRIEPIPYDDVRVVVISDSSFYTDQAAGAPQGSLLVGMLSACLYHNEESPLSIMCWQSQKSKRVVGTNMAAESCSFSWFVCLTSVNGC